MSEGRWSLKVVDLLATLIFFARTCAAGPTLPPEPYMMRLLPRASCCHAPAARVCRSGSAPATDGPPAPGPAAAARVPVPIPIPAAAATAAASAPGSAAGAAAAFTPGWVAAPALAPVMACCTQSGGGGRCTLKRDMVMPLSSPPSPPPSVTSSAKMVPRPP